ncbi:MAG: glycosyltransferase family 4 protein [Amaricoccus sp.]|uniref:glycosyltransferase family 4 protein n=1 Tax=Amaricoccus sp. TaxID=1872485 RepID=UPI0039E29F45
MTSPLRILQIAHDHPEWTPGGTEIVARDLARALDATDGLSARLLVAATSLQRPDMAPGSLGAIGPDAVLRTGAYDRFQMARLDGLGWIESLGRVLRDTRPDVIHLHGLDRLGIEALPVIRRQAPRAQIVLTLHDYQLICANDGLLLTRPEATRCQGASPDACARCFPERTAAQHALRRATLLATLVHVDRFIAPSRFLRDRFVAWGLAAERIEVVPNAVALPAPVAERCPRARRNRFGFFGQIARHKGVLTLLDAARRLKDADLAVTLHGGLGYADAGFRAEFADRLAAADPVAQHLGGYGRGELPARLAAVDWVVVPSLWWENAPLVIEEARAAGRPVIVTGHGGLAEVVADGETGLHVPAGDAAALAETMRGATDPALWARLAAGRGPADFAAFVDAHRALYAALTRRMAA